MNDNKGQTIFLSVIGIATLLVAIIGATFAYFTTTMTGNADRSVNVTTAKVPVVSYNAQSITSDASIYPGWTSGENTLTVTYGAADVDLAYTCSLDITKNSGAAETVYATNTIKDLKLTVTGDDAVTDYATGKEILTSGGTGKIEIAKGTLEKAGGTKTIKYTLEFVNKGADQNTQAGVELVGEVKCELKADELRYTQNGNDVVIKDAEGNVVSQ